MSDQPQPSRSGFVHPDGHDIWYEYFGDGSREAVVLLNGLAMSTKAWYGFLPLLTDEVDVLLYDYLGQGESSKPDSQSSFGRNDAYGPVSISISSMYQPGASSSPDWLFVA